MQPCNRPYIVLVFYSRTWHFDFFYGNNRSVLSEKRQVQIDKNLRDAYGADLYTAVYDTQSVRRKRALEQLYNRIVRLCANLVGAADMHFYENRKGLQSIRLFDFSGVFNGVCKSVLRKDFKYAVQCKQHTEYGQRFNYADYFRRHYFKTPCLKQGPIINSMRSKTLKRGRINPAAFFKFPRFPAAPPDLNRRADTLLHRAL